MKNLAGIVTADNTILEELYLAGIEAVKVERASGEVPYSYIGKIGNWTLRRAWYYWIASVIHIDEGLVLEKAMILHNTKNPVGDGIIGDVVRCNGDCGCPSPDEYAAKPVRNEELDKELIALGYECKYNETLEKSFVSITNGEIRELKKAGKLKAPFYVSSYHIDSQIGLLEFANCVKEI